MNLYIYKIISSLAFPIIFLYLIFRLFKGKEDKKRFKERFGIASIGRPEGKIIWFHASSVGESLSILPLINYIKTHYPNFNILVTTGTINSAAIMASRLPKNCIHQYVPIDNLGAIDRFLKYWQPDLVFWTESEFWPNLLRQTAKTVPIILLNGRISDSSFVSWQKHPKSITKILANFSLILTQSKQDFDRFKTLGTNNIINTGNLKYASAPYETNEPELAKLKRQIGERVVIMAASTHSDEEYKIAKVCKNLKGKFPKLLTIIAPRHPARKEDILADIAKIDDVKVAVRSRGDKIDKDTDIYLADTMGEYGIFYRLPEIVIIGGSFIAHGGQNILEPAKLNNAIIMGPHMHNFKEITDNFLAANAAIQVKDEQELEQKIMELLTNRDKCENLKKNALKLVNDANNVLDIVVAQIKPFLDK